MRFMNIAGYKFVSLEDLSGLRESFLQVTRERHCKGTILLSKEGININLSAESESVDEFKKFLQAYTCFQDISFRVSYSLLQPFKFMRVKIKKEIITMHKEDIHPERQRAKSISPERLKQWLDENREMTLLDTRNEYEVRFGTFKKADHLHINDFSEFPQQSQKINADKPVVMFCTGGIRCEKAALHMLDAGFSEVYQLEGGILNYFAEVGGDHYDGECFVFDQRISVDTQLNETGTTQCHQCEGPIKKEMSMCSDVVCQKCIMKQSA